MTAAGIFFSRQIKTPFDAFTQLVQRYPEYEFLLTDYPPNSKEREVIDNYYTKSSQPTPKHPSLLARPFHILGIPPSDIRGVILVPEIFANHETDTGLPMEFLPPPIPTQDAGQPKYSSNKKSYPQRPLSVVAFEGLFPRDATNNDAQEEFSCHALAPDLSLDILEGQSCRNSNLDILTDDSLAVDAFRDLNRRRFRPYRRAKKNFFEGNTRYKYKNSRNSNSNEKNQDDDDDSDCDQERGREDEVFAQQEEMHHASRLSAWAKRNKILIWSLVTSANHRDRIELYSKLKKKNNGQLERVHNPWYDFTKTLIRGLQHLHNCRLPMLVFGSEPALLCRELELDHALFVYGSCSRMVPHAIVSPFLIKTFLAKIRQHKGDNHLLDHDFFSSSSNSDAQSFETFVHAFHAHQPHAQTRTASSAIRPASDLKAMNDSDEDDSEEDEFFSSDEEMQE